jgi:outer membrane protein assembly factor BamE (lipoprotein component of BamABCDE complex)
MEAGSKLNRWVLSVAALATLAIIFFYGIAPSSSAQNHRNSEFGAKVDFGKLHDMACKLRLGMTREEVDLALGKPKYSPTIGVFYYEFGTTDENGVPFGIVVEYRRQSSKEGETTKYTGKLEEYRVGRIAE